MFYRYGDRRKVRLESILVPLAVGHLVCFCTMAWFGMVIYALIYVWGFSPNLPSPTPSVGFLVGIFIAWVVMVPAASFSIIVYSWNRRRRPPKPAGFCRPINTFSGHPTSLTRCCSDFERLANLDTITPILYQNGVLNTDDVASLVNARTVSGGTRSYQVLHFITLLDRKGKKGFEGVVEALKEDKDHLGHEELADVLTERFNKDHHGGLLERQRRPKPSIYIV